MKFKLITPILLGCIFVQINMSCSSTSANKIKTKPLSAVSFEQVNLADSFWLPRLKTQKEVLVPFSLDKTRPAVDNLAKTAEYLKAGNKQPMQQLARYVDSDLFKVMEGAAYLLTLERDPELEARMDSIIEIIAAAQMPDGYLYEQFEVPSDMIERRWGTGDRPYSFVLHSHELYNMGHMYEGAVAYYKATGKRKWLDVAEKNACHVNKAFFVGDPAYNDGKPVNQAPGHEEIELALVKLFKTTGDSLYLDMARKFIDIRGVSFIPTESQGVMSAQYSQQHLPVRQQHEVSGHAVRAMYLYSAMADVMRETGDTTLLCPLVDIWNDYVGSKMHINGGLGAIPGIEGFGPAYELPNKNTYDETCAAVGNVLFNYRMYLATGDPKYLDVAEIALYNNVLAGVNLEGNKFFYVNVLEADGLKAFNHGKAGRSPWFGTACCPSNMARLIPQVSGMVYTYKDNDVYCALYAGSDAEIPLPSGTVKLSQRTSYPFSGDVSITVDPSVNDQEFTIWLRVPTWSTDRFIPSELYSFADNINPSTPTVKINGKDINIRNERGYIPLRRKWSGGDKISLSLPMDLRYSKALPEVKADSNRVALTRGPLLLCAEGVDNSYPASSYIISSTGDQGKTDKFSEGLMTGIPYVTIPASALDSECNEIKTPLTLVPYYAWNNRGDNGTMNVWFAQDAGTVLPTLSPTIEKVKGVTASYTCTGDDPCAVADGIKPSNSADASIPRWTSWPRLGESQKVEIRLKEPQDIESISVYWYSNGEGVKLPKSWTIDYLKDNKWIPLQPYTTDVFGIAPDQFNMVHPNSPIKAEAIRINANPVKDASVGILEVEIN